jgi:hypothetical protein
MSQSYTRSETTTFNRSDVLHVIWKIHNDLDQLRREYSGWTKEYVENISDDTFQWLYRGYADKVEVFFHYSNNSVVYAVSYSIDRNNQITIDNDAGRIRPKDLSGTTSFIKVTTNSTWNTLSNVEKAQFYTSLKQGWNGNIPSLSFGSGNWQQDKTYASNAFGASRTVYQG